MNAHFLFDCFSSALEAAASECARAPKSKPRKSFASHDGEWVRHCSLNVPIPVN